MPEIELSAGTVAYQDTGGPGPVLVLLHGLVQNGTVWRDVVRDLRADHRCVVPTLPEGGHARPMRPDVPLSPRAVAALVAEFLDRLDLRDVTLAEVDSGRAQTVAAEHPERLAALVLVACETLENYPPGLPGKLLVGAAAVPGGITVLARLLAMPALRRLPVGIGALTAHPAPRELVDDWLRPLLSDRRVRHDLRRYLRGVRRGDMLAAAGKLRGFDRPALVVWARDDLMMPLRYGRRLAAVLPRGRLVVVEDSRTLVPLDQPARLACLIRDFVAQNGRR